MDTNRCKFTQDDLRRLELASREQLDLCARQYFASNANLAYTTLVTITDEVSPADVFIYLLARYGDPNGLFTVLGKSRPDVRIDVLWHYTLNWQNEIVHVIAHPCRIELIFWTKNEVDIDAVSFSKLIRDGLSRHHQEVALARKRVELVKSFLNPLSHMRDAIRRMLARAEYLDSQLVKSREHPRTIEELEWQQRNFEEHSISASEMSGCCLSARMMAPVMAEMFVNLLIYNLYPDIRNDEQGMRDFSRKPILLRISDLHKRCEGFAKEPDESSDPIKAFKELMNRRNDLLHGNIRPLNRIEDQFLVYQDVATPKKIRSMYDRAIVPTVNAFPLGEAMADVAAAEGFMEYLLGCLTEENQKLFLPMLESNDLHHGAKDKRLRAMFSNEFQSSIDPALLEEIRRRQSMQ